MFSESGSTDASTESDDGSLSEWSVVGLGVGLLVASVGLLVTRTEMAVDEFVRFAVPVGFSLFVVALGGWLRTADLPVDHAGVVWLWSLAGSAAMGLLAGWVSLLQSVGGRPLLQPASVVLTTMAVGALGGGLLGVSHGRLRHRTAELAEQRNRLDEFASIVSHDLRNPLNVAQGHLDLARETDADRHFEAVADAHTRMERLIEEVLALSRRGDTVADPAPVALDEVATDAWTTVETPGMELRVETDRTVVSDDRRLRALFENLFRNAVEHGSTSSRPQGDDAVEHGSTNPRSGTHEDAVEHGSASSRPQGDDAVEHGLPDSAASSDGPASTEGTVVVGDLDDAPGFYVADDGPGIPPEDRELVFEGGYSTEPDGTGFGLAVVRRIAEAHDWRVRVTESWADGARFEFHDVDGV
ncbi:sensor histidine kinase [Halorussus halobius]|uniref:sensor histidine kinase n=1 Tax=Halorussus halobius TaxID=1710537 RepID=UPI001092B517|nr:HAMP domain-containing sensor histidine kinase [Halorussus halobius]